MELPIWAARLTDLRKKRDITQDDLRELLEKRGLKIAKGTYSRWENGTNEPGFYALCILADYYGVTTDWIFGRDKNGQEN